MTKTRAQGYIEERLAELEHPRCAGKIAYQQERLSLRRLMDTMRGAGEWVEAQGDGAVRDERIQARTPR